MSARDVLQRGSMISLYVASLCAAGDHPASAQPMPPFYVRADLGWSGTTNANLEDVNFPADHVITGVAGTQGALSDFGGAWLLGAGAGMQFTPRFRGDIVYTYRGRYRLDAFDDASLPSNFRAHISSNSVMATGYADFPIGNSGVVPFIGVGIGWARNDLDSLSWQPTASANIKPAVRTVPGGTSENFAWQAVLGLSFSLTNSLAVDFTYRYFDGRDVKTRPGDIVANGTLIGTYSGARGVLTADEIALSVRFFFGSL